MAIKDWLNPIGSVLNGVAQYFGAREQRSWEEQQADKQFDRNKEMMALQNQYNVENFERELQANSAAGMLERGLNPLWSGQNAGSISPVSALGYDRASARGIENPISAAASGIIQTAQLDLMKAQKDNVVANTAKTNNENVTETVRREDLLARIDETKQKIKESMSREDLNKSEKERLDNINEWYDVLAQADLDLKVSQKELNEAEKALTNEQKHRIEELLPGEKALQRMSIADFTQKWKYWNAQITHMAHQDALLAKQCRYYLVSQLVAGFQGTGLSTVNAFVLQLINNDPDMSDSDKNMLRSIFGDPTESEEDRKKKVKERMQRGHDDLQSTTDPVFDIFN